MAPSWMDEWVWSSGYREGESRTLERGTMMIPQRDESRPLSRVAISLIITVAKVAVFLIELALGDGFILRDSTKPAEIARGKHLETLYMSMLMPHSGVAYFAHIGGFIVGLLLVKPFGAGRASGAEWG